MTKHITKYDSTDLWQIDDDMKAARRDEAFCELFSQEYQDDADRWALEAAEMLESAVKLLSLFFAIAAIATVAWHWWPF